MKHRWWKNLGVSVAVVALLSGPAMNVAVAEGTFTEEEYAKYNLPTDIDPYNRGEEIKAENPAGRAYTSKDFPGYPDDQVLAAHVRLTDVKQNGKLYDSDTWDYYGPQEDAEINPYLMEDSELADARIPFTTYSYTETPEMGGGHLRSLTYRDNGDGTVTYIPQVSYFRDYEGHEGAEWHEDYVHRLFTDVRTVELEEATDEEMQHVLDHMTVYNADESATETLTDTEDPSDEPVEKETEEQATDSTEERTEDENTIPFPDDLDPNACGEEIKAENPADKIFTHEDFPDHTDEEIFAAHVRHTVIKQINVRAEAEGYEPTYADTFNTWEYYASKILDIIYDDSELNRNVVKSPFVVHELRNIPNVATEYDSIFYRKNDDGTFTDLDLHIRLMNKTAEERENPQEFARTVFNHLKTYELEAATKEDIQGHLDALAKSNPIDPAELPDKKPQESTTEDKTVAESKDVDNEKEKKEEKQAAKKEEKQPEKKEEKKKENKTWGERLPDTATTAWILAVIGVVAVLASIAVKKFRKDK